MKREAAGWEAAGTVSSRGVKFVAASCLLWAAVTIGGRLTAYLGSLYPADETRTQPSAADAIEWC